MKKAGVLLVCGLLAGSSIGVTPIFANEIGIVEEEFTTKTVNAATGGYVSYTSGIVDTTNPIAAEELLKKTATMALEFEWQDENREEHSLTWTPQEKDIKEAGNYKIRPGFMMKSFYVHASRSAKAG